MPCLKAFNSSAGLSKRSQNSWPHPLAFLEQATSLQQERNGDRVASLSAQGPLRWACLVLPLPPCRQFPGGHLGLMMVLVLPPGRRPSLFLTQLTPSLFSSSVTAPICSGAPDCDVRPAACALGSDCGPPVSPQRELPAVRGPDPVSHAGPAVWRELHGAQLGERGRTELLKASSLE